MFLSLTATLWIGLFGAVLMLIGDMFLYYDRNDYDSSKGISDIIDIMKKVGRTRLHIGGMLGPISAFFHCIGYYHIVLIAAPDHMTMAFVVFLLCCLGIICGSAFHSECAHLGLMGRYDEKPQLDEVMKYLDFQKYFLAIFSLISHVLLIAMIALGYTALPRWAVLFTPPFVLLLTPLVSRLPKGIHMIVRGGWTNIITVIYYSALLVMMSR